MNFAEQESEFSDKQEPEEEEEEEDEELMTMNQTTSKLPFSSPNSSSSSSSTQFRNFLPQLHHLNNNNNLWLPSSDHQRDSSPNFDKKLDLMDLSLGNDHNSIINGGAVSITSAAASSASEREHMFDKVVTPSDVGKLNRLVIPKQHAEKYFPLDSSSNEKGLLLNFEDRNGKPWRFRYSYWNSSQSYVMTKGWSRFVKEKKLDAGDIVSFQRGVGESGKHRLYIDWRRRPNAPDPTHFELQNQLHFPQSVRWGRLYSLPQPLSPLPRVPYDQSQFHHLNYSIQPYNNSNNNHHHHYQYQHQQYGNPQYYLRPPQPPPPGVIQFGTVHHQQQQADHHQAGSTMVIDSIPVAHGRSVGKRLRLFGVNMECLSQDDQSSSSSDNMVPFSPHLAPQSRLSSSSSGGGGSMSTSRQQPPDHHHEFSKKGKTSLSFDLDL